MKSLINVWYNVYAPKAEWNSTAHLNCGTGSIYLFESNGSASLQEQIHFLVDDESRSHDTKHRSEIQCEALEFSEEHITLI